MGNYHCLQGIKEHLAMLRSKEEARTASDGAIAARGNVHPAHAQCQNECVAVCGGGGIECQQGPLATHVAHLARV